MLCWTIKFLLKVNKTTAIDWKNEALTVILGQKVDQNYKEKKPTSKNVTMKKELVEVILDDPITVISTSCITWAAVLFENLGFDDWA